MKNVKIDRNLPKLS